MIGIDEVGRGCLAGPLLVCAARATNTLPLGLKDSKQLSPKKRLEFMELLEPAAEFGEGWVSVSEINRLGLSKSLTLGATRALKNIKAQSSESIILDGNFNYCPAKYKQVKTIIKADESLPLVSAASIWAKVKRDQYMHELALKYSSYGFENHIGYGTAAHKLAIETYGVINGVHRINFKPFTLLSV